jgi:membrane protein DedA with SNARE-associated domain
VLVRLLAHFGYVAIVALLVGGGVGVPVPEELIQLTAGYLARREILAFLPALISVYVGIVGGDLLFFFLARRHADRFLSKPRLQRVLTPSRRATLERHFARHAFLTIMAARHMSGLRIPAYALAATHGVRMGTFFLADALSALLSVPLVVTIGYVFAAHIEDVRRRVHEVELALLGAVLVAAGVVILVKWRRSRSSYAPVRSA